MFVAPMELHSSQDVRWLRSRPTDPGLHTEKIDAENGILYDVVMVQEGEAKGHGVFLDADFIQDLVRYDQRYFSKRGLKARFGHPGASSETMGTQMGVFRDFRFREQKGQAQAIANLHLLNAAEESPTHPGMRSWVLKMAEERPDFLMSSIVFRPGGYFQLDENGKKVYIGNQWMADEKRGKVFVEFGKKGEHMATDIVEEGAATDNLFSHQVNPHLFVSQAGQFLAEHPELKQFIIANPEKVITFFSGLGITITQPKQNMSKFSVWKWLTGESQDAEPALEDLDPLKTEFEEVRKEVAALKSALAETERHKDTLENRLKEVEADNATLQTNLAALKSEAEALKADAKAKADEIEALKKEAAAEHTNGETDPSPGKEKSKTPKWDAFRAQHGL